MPRADIDLVLFDLGGVLVEIAGIDRMIEWCQGSMGEDEVWSRWLASPSVRLYEAGGCATDEFARRVVAELELPVTPGEFLEEFAGWPRRLYPFAASLLRDLRSTHTTACLSNTSLLHWEHMRDELGLGELIDHPFLSFELGMVKPDREIFERVVSELGTAPGRILYIDDNQPNVDAARDVGIEAWRARGEEVPAVVRRAMEGSSGSRRPRGGR